MPDFYALTRDPLPTALYGSDAEHSIRPISEQERLSIEDYFFARDIKIALNAKTSAVIVSRSHAPSFTIEEFAVLIECALGVVTVSGFQSISFVAKFNGSNCSEAQHFPHQTAAGPPLFPRKLGSRNASTWVRNFFLAHSNAKGTLHITADRFVRYLRANNTSDSLVDLCICLESLIESQTEISFRFATCLAKICTLASPAEISDLLGDLYDLRSKVVHGTDSTRAHKKIMPNIIKLRLVSRAILLSYILFMTEHSKEEWKRHLKISLFK